MERILTFLNRLLYVIAIALLIVVAVYIVSFITFGRSFVVYPIVFGNNSDDFFAIPVMIFLLIGIALAVLKLLSRLLVGKYFHNRLGARAVFIAFFANGLVCCGIPLVSIFGDSVYSPHNTLNRLYVNDHVYYFAQYSERSLSEPHYLFYECDRFGIFCHQLQDFSSGWNTTNPITAAQIELVENPTDNTIAVHINGEVAWTYVP